MRIKRIVISVAAALALVLSGGVTSAAVADGGGSQSLPPRCC
jgi:hypothetical protein